MTTATAHPNFALIKYWGKGNEKLNLPAVGSISVTVDKLIARTSVKFDWNLKKDVIKLNNTKVDQRDSKRITSFLDLVRDLAGDRRFAEVNSLNNFPTAAGLSSSSAGFAALAGFLYAHYVTFLSPGTFSLNFSVLLVTMVAVGGREHIWGAIVGTAVLTILPEYLRFFQDFDILIYGVILMAIMLLRPEGLYGIKIPIRRKVDDG